MSKGTMQKMWASARMGKEPDIKEKDGKFYGRLSVATDGGLTKDKETDKYMQKTAWLDVSVFGNDAKFCKEYINKGDLVSLELQVQNNKWTDKEGKDTYGYDFICKEIKLSAKAEQKTDEPLADIQ